MKHSIRIFTTRAGNMVELDGNVIEPCAVEISMRGGRVRAVITMELDECDLDLDVDPQKLIQRPALHRFRLDFGQAYLDDRPISAEEYELNPDKNGKTGTVDLKQIAVVFEEVKS